METALDIRLTLALGSDNPKQYFHTPNDQNYLSVPGSQHL